MIGDFAADPGPRRPRGSLGHALQRFVGATQRLAADRTDLLKVEAGEEVREGVKSLQRVVAGALLLSAGWALVVAALVTWLSRRAAPELVFAAVGGGHALLGLLLLVRRERKQR
jgi:hypothetical protein